jgi:fructose-1,6-bisphosphatase/inositol monophosphatase family enzyme
MKVVCHFQVQGAPPAEVKESDQTLVTLADRQSGSAMRAVIQHALSDVAILGEDMNNLEQHGSTLIALLDPLDGTRAFTNGLTTSTVIAGIYDTTTRRLLSCVIGEPISGRIWTSGQNQPTSLDLPDIPEQKTVKVWEGPLSMQSTVFIDLSHGFTSRGRQILTSDQIANLFTNLNQETVILMPGSNGLHQALVANGGEKLAGSVTTAIGGPWDVCGALLVLQAGGAAQGLSMSDDRLLTKVHPLDVLSYDMLVTGNSQTTVDTLVKIILAVNGQR